MNNIWLVKIIIHLELTRFPPNKFGKMCKTDFNAFKLPYINVQVRTAGWQMVWYIVQGMGKIAENLQTIIQNRKERTCTESQIKLKSKNRQIFEGYMID